MRNLIAFSFVSGLLLSSIVLSDVLEPNSLSKEIGSYKMGWGEYAGEFLWDYSIEGQCKFHVVDSLVSKVDAIIATAREKGAKINHVDPEVMWFCEQELIEKNLLLY